MIAPGRENLFDGDDLFVAGIPLEVTRSERDSRRFARSEDPFFASDPQMHFARNDGDPLLLAWVRVLSRIWPCGRSEYWTLKDWGVDSSMRSDSPVTGFSRISSVIENLVSPFGRPNVRGFFRRPARGAARG